MSRRAWASALPFALVFWLAIGIVFGVVRASGLPTHSWLGAKSYDTALTGTAATCSLGAATGTDSVWAAVTGSASLDIIQVGALLSNGQPRYFMAWGKGEPNAAGSAYTEVDLGPADRGAHRYSVQKSTLSANWFLSIDGRSQLLPDSFRTWSIRAGQVQNEVQQPEPMGPVSCSAMRTAHGVLWTTPVWSFGGAGPSSNVPMFFGSDWFIS